MHQTQRFLCELAAVAEGSCTRTSQRRARIWRQHEGLSLLQRVATLGQLRGGRGHRQQANPSTQIN